MNIDKSYNFKAINDHLTTSGVIPEEALKNLSNQDYQAVINLLPDDDEHLVADEKQIIESQGIQYFHIPVDFDQPTQADVEEFLAVLKGISDQTKTHIHCAANWRVSAFYGIYAVKDNRWTSVEARQFIDGIWNPKDFPVWEALLDQYGINAE